MAAPEPAAQHISFLAHKSRCSASPYMLSSKHLASHAAPALPRLTGSFPQSNAAGNSRNSCTRPEQRCLGYAMDTGKQRALWCEIVKHIQDAELYADSKHAVDLAVLTPWPDLAAAWEEFKRTARNKKDLASFVEAHFGPPGRCSLVSRCPLQRSLPPSLTPQLTLT